MRASPRHPKRSGPMPEVRRFHGRAIVEARNVPRMRKLPGVQRHSGRMSLRPRIPRPTGRCALAQRPLGLRTRDAVVANAVDPYSEGGKSRQNSGVQDPPLNLDSFVFTRKSAVSVRSERSVIGPSTWSTSADRAGRHLRGDVLQQPRQSEGAGHRSELQVPPEEPVACRSSRRHER